jgi:hypothetical protein
MSGLTADARTLIEHARVEAQQHTFTYNEAIPVESLTQSLCDLALRFGEEDDDDAGGMVSDDNGLFFWFPYFHIGLDFSFFTSTNEKFRRVVPLEWLS